MKNSKIHQGFEKSEIRDFLGTALLKSSDQELSLAKKPVPFSINSENSLEWLIRSYENEMELLKEKIAILNERSAILSIIKKEGWKEFDVSDETKKDHNYTLWMNFIGTEEEYANLIESIDRESEKS